MKKLLLFLFATGIVCMWYWYIVMTIVVDKQRDGNHIGMESATFYLKYLNTGDPKYKRASDSCEFIARYLYSESDRIRHEYLPKIVRP